MNYKYVVCVHKYTFRMYHDIRFGLEEVMYFYLFGDWGFHE